MMMERGESKTIRHGRGTSLSRAQGLVALLAAVLVACLSSSTPASAGEVMLAWNPVTDTDLAGYKLYWRTAAGNYTNTNSLTISDPAATTGVVTGLTDGVTYYFVATAYNTSGRESGYSNEVTMQGWRVGETDLGSGWKASSWFGTYFISYTPWVYHLQHGFLFSFDDGNGGGYFWDDSMGQFWWTSSTAYPWLYRFGSGAAWLLYQKDTANPRWFYNAGTGSWVSQP